MRYMPFLISLALTIYALFSCIQTPDEEVPYLPKLVWVILIVLVPFVGPIAWLFLAWSYRQRAGGGQPRGPRPSGPLPSTGPPRSSAPDDDPEFLAWLARQQRRKSPPRPRPADPSDGSAGKTGADGNEDPDDGRGGVA